MAELTTKKNDAGVEEFLSSVEHEGRREDSFELLEVMRDVTGEPGSMWGDSMVGFGTYDYRYATGREGTWFKLGFSPRKRDLTIYLMDGVDKYPEQLQRLGRHRLGKACLYLGRLSSVDPDVLREILEASWSVPSMGEAQD